MRTIKETTFNRLVVQAAESDLQNLTNVSNAVTKVIESYADNVRTSDEYYEYNKSALQEEISEHLWECVVRIADFYNVQFDSVEVSSIVDSQTDILLDEVKKKLNITSDIGAYESGVPGQDTDKASIEVTEED